MFLQPARGEEQVIAEAVVERERRVTQAGSDDERENRAEQDGETHRRVAKVDR